MLVPVLLMLACAYAGVQADYQCLCAYAVETNVYTKPDTSSPDVGLLYEFDCKPVFQANAPFGFIPVMFENKLGYVVNASTIEVQICQGSVPREDLVTTTLPPLTTLLLSSKMTFIKTTTLAPTTTRATTVSSEAQSTPPQTTPTPITNVVTTPVVLTTKPGLPTTTPSVMTIPTTTTMMPITTSTIPTTTTTIPPTTTTITTTMPINTTTMPTTTTMMPTTTTTSSTTTTTTTIPTTTTTIPTTTTIIPTTTTTIPTTTTTIPTTTTTIPTTTTTIPTTTTTSPTTTTTIPTTTTTIPTTTTTIRTTTSTTPLKPTSHSIDRRCPSSIFRRTKPEYVYSHGVYCYEYLQRYASWKTANHDCKSHDGFLLSIHNKDEQDFVLNMLNSIGTLKPVWLGLSDQNHEGVWQWVSGGVPSYKNWMSGTDHENYVNKENCAVIVAARKGQWDDVHCEGILFDTPATYPWVCQYHIR